MDIVERLRGGYSGARDEGACEIERLRESYIKAWQERDAQRRRAESAETRVSELTAALRKAHDFLDRHWNESEILRATRATLAGDEQ